MRGKRKLKDGENRYLRITPAGAGKTAMRLSLRVTSEDHPRRCGENRVLDGTEKDETGSPPQVRGKQRGSTWTAQVTGITPAGAGKTFNVHVIIACTWDHPRRCGENR